MSLYITDENGELHKIAGAGGGSTTTVDSELNSTSENPVQNKVLYNPVKFAEAEREKSKNLFKTPYEAQGFTHGGITFAFKDGKSISLSGTRTVSSGIVCNLLTNFTLKAGTYTMSTNKVGEFAIQTSDDNWFTFLRANQQSTTFTLTEDKVYSSIYIAVTMGVGESINLEDIFIQLEEGSVATDIQPYNGDIVRENQISGLSNTNLLINGDFRINQRGQSSYNTAFKYTVDRWFIFDNGLVVTPNADGSITLQNTGSNFSHLLQYIENPSMLSDKLVTFSMQITSINGIAFFSGYDGVNDLFRTNMQETGIFAETIRIPSNYNRNYLRVGIYLPPNSSVTVKYIKFEIGSVATPNNPRPYAEELAMCQRYFRKIDMSPALGLAINKKIFEIPVSQAQGMRSSITAYNIVLGGWMRGNGEYHETANLSLNKYYSTNKINLENSSDVFTQGHTYGVSWITFDLDAEIY